MKWLSLEQVSSHLGVSKETVYRHLAKGSIPAYRVGKLWKFSAEEIDAWVLNGCRVTKTQKAKK